MGDTSYGICGNCMAEIDCPECGGVSESELKELLAELIDAVDEYVTYHHDGDPFTEDARTMGEMTLNEMHENGKIKELKRMLGIFYS